MDWTSYVVTHLIKFKAKASDEEALAYTNAELLAKLPSTAVAVGLYGYQIWYSIFAACVSLGSALPALTLFKDTRFRV